MISGYRLCPLLIYAYTLCFVHGEAPKSHYSGYHTAPSYSNFQAPPSNYGVYDASTHKSTYGVPSEPSYGPPPISDGHPEPHQHQEATQDGYESLRDFATAPESAFIQRRLFNTSVALTVPLFSFTLPQRASQGSTVDLANQAIFGLFSLLVVVLIFAVPILFTGSRPAGLTGRSNNDRTGILNHLMTSKKVFNFMGADFTNNIGLDTNKCLQKTICEAHKFPKKYGVMASPFLIFFPAPGNGTSNARASLFQLAARDGKAKKDCGKQYKCFFDILDLCEYFLDWWTYSSNTNGDYVVDM